MALRRKAECTVRASVSERYAVKATFLDRADPDGVPTVTIALDFGDTGASLSIGVLEARLLGAFLERL